MTITAKASVALEKARVLEHQKEWKDAWYYYTIASREKSAEGTRGVERMLPLIRHRDRFSFWRYCVLSICCSPILPLGNLPDIGSLSRGFIL